MFKTLSISDAQAETPGQGTKPEEWIRRVHPRVACNVPTKFRDSNTNQYFDLNIRNISQGGLYFESAQRLPLGTNLDIFIGDDVSGPELLKEAKHYKTRVKWIDEARPGAFFGAGVEIVSKSNFIEACHARNLLCACDLCGRYTFYNKLCSADECIYLCRACSNKYPQLLEGIKKYLLGNIY